MKMFERDGFLRMSWKEGSDLIVQGHGGTADTLLALCAGIKEVIENTVPPEEQLECSQELTLMLLKMMRTSVTTIDLGAMGGAGPHG